MARPKDSGATFATEADLPTATREADERPTEGKLSDIPPNCKATVLGSLREHSDMLFPPELG
jgi:hypothetical protein